MAYTDILAKIDAELSRLQEAKRLLSGTPDVLATLSKGRGRPKGSTNAPKPEAAPAKAKRVMSDEARARIGEATRKRHASNKRAAKKAAKEAAQAEATE